MKLIALCLFVAVASQALVLPEHEYEIGKTYSYEYKAYTVSGLPLVSNERNGIAIWSRVLINFESTDKVTVQLEKPVMRQISLESQSTLSVDSVPSLKVALELENEFRTLPEHMQSVLSDFIERPVTLVLRNGKIEKILADEKEPEWVLTLKSGLFHQFQIPKMTTPVLTATEDNLMGKECLVDYDMMVPHKDSRNAILTSKFSLESCLYPVVHDDLIKFANEPHKDSGEGNLRSSFITKFNITQNERIPFVNEWISEGRYTLSIFTPNHGEATVYTRQEMQFIQVESRKLISSSNSRQVIRRSSITPSMIHHKISDIPHPEEVKIDLIKSLFSEIIQRIESETEPTFEIEMTEKFTLAVDFMTRLEDPTSFKKIVEMATMEQNKLMRQMIVMAMSNCHSPVLVESLRSIESKLTTLEMTNILIGLGLNGVPTYDLVHQLKQLFVQTRNDLVKEQTILAIGSQVYQLCRPFRVYGRVPIKTNHECTEGMKQEFVNFFKQELKSTSDEIRQMIVLKALGNSGLDMTTILEPMIISETLPIELRVNAIYAMRRNHEIESVVSVLMPLYRRHTTPVELRIAAFNTLIEVRPTREMLASLVSHLNEEPCMQLGNYLYSYLDSLVNLPTIFAPSRQLTIEAQNLLSTVKRFEGGLWYSQNRQFILHQLGVRVWHFIEASFVSTPEQALPRAGLLRLTRQYCGYFLNDIEVGFRMEGADNFIQEIYNKFFNEEMIDQVQQYLPSGSRSFARDINRIHSMLNINSVENRNIEKPQGHVFFKALGAEIGLFRFDSESLNELTSNVFNELISLGKNRIFDVQSLFPSQVKAQTPMGVVMIADFTTLTMTSIHTDDVTRSTNKNTVWSKDVTVRNIFKNRVLFGVNMGPLDIAIGSTKHVKTVLPHTWEITFDSETSKTGVEVFWNIEDPMYKTMTPENFELVKIVQTPINYVLSVDCEKKEIDLKFTPVHLHPLLTSNDERYTFDFFGHELKSTQHVRDLTLMKPAFPVDGHHVITLRFYDNKVRPFGIKFDVEYIQQNEKLGVMMLVGLNTRVVEHKREVKLSSFISLERDEKNIAFADLVLEITPMWIERGTYRIFVISKTLKGRDSQTLTWLNAGEDSDVEMLYGMKYGWNEQFNLESQDLLLKYRMSKSKLQKFFETEDVKLVDSDCFKCEQIKKETSVWTNIHCERCLFKRQSLTQKTYTLFLNEQKTGSKWMKYLVEYMDQMNMEFLNRIESFEQKELITPSLIREESELLSKYMKHIDQSQVEGLRRIEDIHPYWTESTITSISGRKHLMFTHVPMLPSLRRLDNLPLDRLTDVMLQREGFETRGVCHIDSRNVVKTMDEVVYRIPSTTTECERVLARDCTERNSFQIDMLKTKDSNEVVRVKLGEHKIEIMRTKDSFTVKLDSKIVPLTTLKLNEFSYELLENNEIVTGSILVVRDPQNRPVKQLRLNLEKVYTTIVMVEEYIKIEVPFWYKNKMCGLCGDFNTETVKEYKLPNQTVARDLKSFLEAYSSDKCKNQ